MVLGKTHPDVYDFRYVLDGFPNTIKQAELLGSRNLIPLVIFELELETVEVLKRGLADKMKPNKSVTAIYQQFIFSLMFLNVKLLTATQQNVLHSQASPKARQLRDHPHSQHLLQAGGGGGEALLQGRVSELDPDGWPEEPMVDLE